MEKYKVLCLLWMIRYIPLFTNAFTQWIHIGAYFIYTSLFRHNSVDTSMTLDAAKWNGAELSSCVINNIRLDHVS